MGFVDTLGQGQFKISRIDSLLIKISMVVCWAVGPMGQEGLIFLVPHHFLSHSRGRCWWGGGEDRQ